ncbi:hypothetical protein MJO28_001558 [Puccinia striiformis f. sp. tritici]|nr:hypothetical protein Pst134EA_003190 [Puccinia striiformis f. sp. tritici]KAH9472583.1 hypothetical protein Pst134EA_003190 [Puccinia striiformis f. sp. tritici]KAI7961069.1 hypothetical protein MJO28_001558 [Puccinia striiformis f. sp. tritici]KAI7965852.1 hypothetical protein MJO29_001600 [Puccinia striiformis f. sp. tritici]KAI9626109.1 hypothetical protein H4Q26_015854 [Puccinia striiformis f. sp. tritici PST-130]
MSASSTPSIKRQPESVWDYPRPPTLVPTTAHLRVVHVSPDQNGQQLVIADTHNGLRVLETSHPPTYYFPPEDVQMCFLKDNPKMTYCEWKGHANYYDLIHPSSKDVSKAVAWTYKNPTPSNTTLANHISFYAGGQLRCFVDDEEVVAQEGTFYGGWKTSEISGGEKGIKGGVGTMGW